MNWQKERFFELVVIINQEYSARIEAMLDGYRNLIQEHEGRITRVEDWGLRNFAYKIEKYRKGHYFLINFACSNSSVLDALHATFEGDNPSLRMLLTTTKKEVTEESPIKKAQEQDEEALADEQQLAKV